MKRTWLSTLAVLVLMSVFVIPVQNTFASTWLVTRGLYADQNMHIGNVVVAIEGENLEVTYNTWDGWELTETHLYVSTNMPTKHAPGKFPYKYENPGGFTTYTYSIPLSELGVQDGETLYIAAHAVVQKWMCDHWWEETAWTCGTLMGKGWATYFSIDIPSND